MKNNVYCSYELSKKLKAKGFDWECTHSYHYGNFSDNDFAKSTVGMCSSPFVNNHNKSTSYIYSAPVLEQAQKWIRVTHNIDITIEPRIHHNTKIGYIYKIWNNNTAESIQSEMLVEYNAVLSAAINKACDFIKNVRIYE